MDLLDGIDVACPACGRRSRYPVVHAGKSVSCPACKHEHLLPGKDSSGAQGLPGASPPVPPSIPKVPTPPAVAKLATAAPAAKAGDAEKILFVCSACQYRARIPAQYAGMAVRCPSCDVAQIANTDASGGTTGNTVQLSKLPTPGHKTTIRAGNVLFICSQCNFEAQLAKHYVGKAIRCPGCHAPQVVAGDPAPREPAALERTTPVSADAPPISDPRFICVGCGYRARIPSQYMGLAVTCPKCDTVQIATPEDQEGPSTGDTVSISRMNTAADGAKVANPQVAVAAAEPGIKMPTSKAPPSALATPAKSAAPTAAAGGGDKVRFTCSSCGFKARIPSIYAGENIHCPGCNSVQFVLRSGQMSPNASGNTQILQVVQTAETAGSPDAIATPTHTPTQGLPVISDPAAPPVAKPAAAVAKPAAPPVAKPAPPQLTKPAPPQLAQPAPPKPSFTPLSSPSVPVAQPAGTAKAEATIDDLLNFEDPPPEQPKAGGKVVRRGSDRLSTVGAKTTTPLPGKMATPLPAKMATPLPERPAAMAAPVMGLPTIDDDPPSDPLPAASAAKSAAKMPVKPVVKTDRTVKPSPRAEAKDDMPAVPVKQSNALVVVGVLFGLAILLAILGGGGFFGWKMMEKMDDMGVQLQTVRTQLDDTKKQLDNANDKLSKAQEDAKLAQEKADLAVKKQAEEAEARKVSEAKAVELEAKLKAAEEAAAKAAADAKAASEKPAPVQTPPAVETPK